MGEVPLKPWPPRFEMFPTCLSIPQYCIKTPTAQLGVLYNTRTLGCGVVKVTMTLLKQGTALQVNRNSIELKTHL